jgi:hypothetical protein
VRPANDTMTDPPADLPLIESDEGWPYASSLPVAGGDPGRFHALFGRDALITSLQLLPVRPHMAHATVRALAARQGREANPRTQEEPGKIGHEFRLSPPAQPSRRRVGRPRALSVLRQRGRHKLVLRRAGGNARRAARPSARARMARGGDWIARTLDSGGGLLRHSPGSFPGGLSQQGWRDTIDPTRPGGTGVLRADATRPRPPLSDLDTQAVTVSALRALAALSGEDVWRQRAEALRARLSKDFDPDVVALEAGDRGGPRRGVAARMPAVGRCARAGGSAGGGRQAQRAGRSHTSGGASVLLPDPGGPATSTNTDALTEQRLRDPSRRGASRIAPERLLGVDVVLLGEEAVRVDLRRRGMGTEPPQLIRAQAQAGGG